MAKPPPQRPSPHPHDQHPSPMDNPTPPPVAKSLKLSPPPPAKPPMPEKTIEYCLEHMRKTATWWRRTLCECFDLSGSRSFGAQNDSFVTSWLEPRVICRVLCATCPCVRRVFDFACQVYDALHLRTTVTSFRKHGQTRTRNFVVPFWIRVPWGGVRLTS